MKTKKSKSAAILTIHDAEKFTRRGRMAIASWLRRQAGFILAHSELLSTRYTARYLYA